MYDSFLENLLNAAHLITKADRAMAVDNDLQVVAMINLTEADLNDRDFSDCASKTLRRALDEGQAVITNNLIADPSDAPKTNTNLAGLRFVIGIPVPGAGAIYLDQRIRFGVISQDAVGTLERVVAYIAENKLENSPVDDILAIYEQLA